ncbi:MAG: transporter substrate-binding domain-containing protein [Eubacterium sp.]
MKKAKKILAVVLAVLMVCVSFAACSKSNDTADTTAADNTEATESAYDAIVAKGTLVVGITNYEPMDYKDAETGEWTGFDAEFATAVAEKMGVKVEFVEINWDNKFIELNSGNIDCIWNGMTISDSVITNCDVSNPYAENSQVVVMKKDKLDSYKTTDSLKDIAIAVEKGSAGETEAKKLTSNVISLTAQSDALKEVKSGTADACIIDSTMANSMTADGKDFDDLGYTLKLTTEQYGIGFKKDTDMAEKINAMIDELKADGTLKKLSEKYYIDLAE